jgi:tripartite-type tricarboxylate transporter receptor subunit TctC
LKAVPLDKRGKLKMKLTWKKFGLLCLMVFVMFLGACGSNEATETSNQSSEASKDSASGETKEAEKPKSNFPEKDIEFVVGYKPGGGYSDYAQALAPFLKKHLPNDVNVLVRHMPGAGSVTATNYIQAANPDGYTIGIYNVAGLAPTQLSQEVAYDLNKVEWLAGVDVGNNVLLVKAGGAYNSVEDFPKDKKLIVATKGLQSQDTIAGAITLSELGNEWVSLNHEGTGDAALTVIRGDADMMFGSYESVQQYIQSGDLKPLIWYGDKPNPDFPDVPIPSDLGLSPEINDGFNSQRLIGATPGIPADAKEILVTALEKTLKDPEFLAQMEKMKRSILYATPDDSKKMVESSLNGFTKFKPIVDALYEQK